MVIILSYRVILDQRGEIRTKTNLATQKKIGEILRSFFRYLT